MRRAWVVAGAVLLASPALANCVPPWQTQFACAIDHRRSSQHPALNAARGALARFLINRWTGADVPLVSAGAGWHVVVA